MNHKADPLVDNSLANLSPSQKRELLAKLLKDKAIRESGSPDEFPMSAGQQGLWYAYRRDPDITAYNVFLPSRFRSRVDLVALRKTIQALVDRHASLRCVFAETEVDRLPVGRIAAASDPEFLVIDASEMNESQLQRSVLDQTQRPFDLTTGPLLRVAAFRIADDDLVVIATTHHIVVDFWSLILLMDEIRTIYPSYAGGSNPELPPAVCNYHQFVETQNRLNHSTLGRQLATFWKHQLRNTPPVLDWQPDFERPERFTHRASVTTLEFLDSIAKKIQALARRMNVTSSVVVMALLQVLIGRFSQQDAFSIGTPFSGRSQREFENTVGFFVNVLPITADLSANPSLEQLVTAVGRTMVDALAHEALPLSEIVRENAPGRDPSRHPLFQVSCTFEKAQVASEEGRAGFLLEHGQTFDNFAGLVQESYYLPHPTCHYDMEFVFEVGDDAVRGMICYCRDLFDASTIQSLAKQFPALALRLLDHPGLPVKQVPWDASVETLDGTYDSAFDQTLRSVWSGSESGIVRRSQVIASELLIQGVRVGDYVPVWMYRGPNAWASILAVMRIGGVPIPIDADQPAVKPVLLCEDANVQVMLADRPDLTEALSVASTVKCFNVNDWLDGKTLSAPNALHSQDIAPDGLAYAIYTSGSTGRPKGVLVSHRAISNTLRWRREAVPLADDDRVLMLLSHQFDASMAIVLTTIDQGADLVWPDQTAHIDVDLLVEQIIRDGVTVLPCVPSLLRAVANHPKFFRCTSLRQIWCGGEAMPTDLPSLVRSQIDCKIWNFYGPTEAAVEATAVEVSQIATKRNVPIGYPITGATITLLDEHHQPVPVGVPGQIAIGGRGLAEGYLNRPELTSNAFVTLHPAATNETPHRVYLTGDRGRRRGDGMIEFLGRIDHQVKVQGYRIELEEIESVLERFNGVRRAAVKVIDPGTGRARLAAFVELLTDDAATPLFDLDAFHRYCVAQLPTYKRPASTTLVDRLPIGTSGKLQRSRLPEPDPQQSKGSESTEPRSDLERFLISRFEPILQVSGLGIEDNFFESGGTSLQAAVLTSKLSDELGIRIPTSLIFDLGNVDSIAARLVQLHPKTIAERFGAASCDLARIQPEESTTHSLLANLKSDGDRHPVFMVHPPGGIVLCYREIAASLSGNQPLVAIRSRGLHGDETLPESIEAMASDYVGAIRQRQPAGKYLVGGWSLGGVIAYEVARQLVASGAQVAGLILLDSTVPEKSDATGPSAGQEYGIDLSLAELSQLSGEDQLPFLYEHAQRLGVLDESTPREVTTRVIEDLRRLFSHHVDLCQAYQLYPIDMPLLLLRPTEVPGDADPRPDRGWSRWTGRVSVKSITGHHHSMVQQPGASEVARCIEDFAAVQTAPEK